MRSILSERNIVIVLFIMVLVTFSLAHEDTKKMEQLYQGANATTATTAKEEPAEKSAVIFTAEKLVVPTSVTR